MFREIAVTALVLVASAAPALAQEEPLSARYTACQTEDRRIAGVCDALDEVNRHLIAARGQTRRQAELRSALSSALFALGAENDDRAYRDCIEISREAQVYYRVDRFPTSWSMLQYRIGSSMLSLGARGDEAARNEAPAALSAAVDAIDRADQPELWAITQERLGDAYFSQSQGENRDLLMQALTAYQAALEIFRRPVFEEHRVRVEASIAEIYRRLGQEPDPA